MEGRKEQALSHIKRKMSYEKMVGVTSAYYDNIVRIIGELENSMVARDVVALMEGANESLGIALEELNPERIESLRESLEDKFDQIEVCVLLRLIGAPQYVSHCRDSKEHLDQ